MYSPSDVSEMRKIEQGKDYTVYQAFGKDNEILGKMMASPEANYLFDYRTGEMMTWGRTMDMDAVKFPGPNILDMEVTTICKHGCPFCYKSNTKNGINMTLDTFKKIVDAFPKTLTQIALGADYDLSSNPDIWNMMAYAREQNIVPNITLGYCDDETADKLVKYCGACAVSRYESADKCYDSIKRLTDRGLKQTNMHFMIAEETYDLAMKTLEDITSDPRLAKLNAIVFLSLKQKGRGTGYHVLAQEKFKALTDYAHKHNIGIGFDSCSSLKAIRALGESIKPCVMDCESSLESSYVNVKGEYFPCSFCEGSLWKTGLNVLECQNSQEFIEKIWNHKETEKFRAMLLNTAQGNEHNCRECPVFTI